MLLFFLTPHPEELFGGAIARYHRRQGPRPYGLTAKELMGSESAVVQNLFPGNIDYLCAQLHPQSLLTPIKLIADHTLYPMYRPFLNAERAKSGLKYMRNSESLDLPMDRRAPGPLRFSLLAGCTFKYCPECYLEDAREWGEAYWHRDHQHFGVLTCHKHDVMLIDTGLPLAPSQGKREFYLLDREYPAKSAARKFSPEEMSHLRYITESVHWLLNNTVPDNSMEILRYNYSRLVIEKGYAHASSIMSHSKVSGAFASYYGSGFLELMSCGLPDATDKNWLVRLLKKKDVVTDPLRHLLAIRFLGEDVKDILLFPRAERNPLSEMILKKESVRLELKKELKCRFCSWSTAKVFRDRNGRLNGIDNAHERIRDHVESNHPVAFRKILQDQANSIGVCDMNMEWQ